MTIQIKFVSEKDHYTVHGVQMKQIEEEVLEPTDLDKLKTEIEELEKDIKELPDQYDTQRSYLLSRQAKELMELEENHNTHTQNLESLLSQKQDYLVRMQDAGVIPKPVLTLMINGVEEDAVLRATDSYTVEWHAKNVDSVIDPFGGNEMDGVKTGIFYRGEDLEYAIEATNAKETVRISRKIIDIGHRQ